MIEIKSTTGYVRRECLTPEITQGDGALEELGLDGESIDPKISENELPQFIIYTLFVMLTGYLSLNTFLRHGIRRYFQKKVGTTFGSS